jgi:hypothetical protein
MSRSDSSSGGASGRGSVEMSVELPRPGASWSGLIRQMRLPARAGIGAKSRSFRSRARFDSRSPSSRRPNCVARSPASAARLRPPHSRRITRRNPRGTRARIPAPEPRDPRSRRRPVGDGDAEGFDLFRQIRIVDRGLAVRPRPHPALQAPQDGQRQPAISNCGASTRGGEQSSHFRKRDADAFRQRFGCSAASHL